METSLNDSKKKELLKRTQKDFFKKKTKIKNNCDRKKNINKNY